MPPAILPLLLVLLYLILVLTDIWVIIDSARLKIARREKNPYSVSNGPVAWVLGCIVLWAIIFPWYLYRRARALKERGQHTGASSAVTWLGIVLLVVALACTAAQFIPPSKSAVTEQLRDTVSASMQQTFQKNPAQRNIRVKSFGLAHETGDLYKGLLVTDESGREMKYVVEVNYDGKNIKWQIH